VPEVAGERAECLDAGARRGGLRSGFVRFEPARRNTWSVAEPLLVDVQRRVVVACLPFE